MNKKTLVVIGLAIAVAMLFVLTASAADKVGVNKCKMCHKIQYDSWAASKHAAQNPQVIICSAPQVTTVSVRES